MEKASLTVGLLVGLIIGAIGGYLIVYPQLSAKDEEIGRLKDEILTLHNEAEAKTAEINRLQGKVSELNEKVAKITSLESDLKAKMDEISSLKAELSELMNRTASLEAEVEKLKNDLKIKTEENEALKAENDMLKKKIAEALEMVNRTKIVQSVEYLFRMNGTLPPEGWRKSVMFMPTGKVLKLNLKFSANQKIVTNLHLEIEVYYVYAGKHIRIYEYWSYPSWDFHNELKETLHVFLDKIPSELLGKVPLYVYYYLDFYNGRPNPAFVIYWELTGYDVYPP